MVVCLSVWPSMNWQCILGVTLPLSKGSWDWLKLTPETLRLGLSGSSKWMDGICKNDSHNIIYISFFFFFLKRRENLSFCMFQQLKADRWYNPIFSVQIRIIPNWEDRVSESVSGRTDERVNRLKMQQKGLRDADQSPPPASSAAAARRWDLALLSTQSLCQSNRTPTAKVDCFFFLLYFFFYHRSNRGIKVETWTEWWWKNPATSTAEKKEWILPIF